jgi:hypothetical protein
MSGTIFVGKQKSLDIKTVDFIRIVGAIRAHATASPVAKRIVDTVDNFGMNMIFPDELDTADFASFYELMKRVRSDLGADPSLAAFLDQVCRLIESDNRLVDK